jgi:hypothetical protein
MDLTPTLIKVKRRESNTTVKKNIMKPVKLQNLVANCCKYRKYSLAKFAYFQYICIRAVAISARNTNVLIICKLRKAIFSVFYNISQPNFAILLILISSLREFTFFLLNSKISLTCKLSILYTFSHMLLENTCMQKISHCWQNHCIFRTWSWSI